MFIDPFGRPGEQLAARGIEFCYPPIEDVTAELVLVTHEHFDHVAPEKLIAAAKANPELQVWAPAALAEQFTDVRGQVHGVRHGETFDVGGVEVQVFGTQHALIHRDIPVVDNVGYRVAAQVFHPGDSFTVPEVKTPVLLAPSGGPWLRVSELVDFIREADPRQVYLIHDAVLTEAGQKVVSGALMRLAGEAQGREIVNWQPGDAVEVG